ncbi:MAG: tetratricopeptide repeat protein, partial [Bacteroidota bacterium]
MDTKGKLFVDGTCPDAGDLFLYTKGKLPASQIHQIEAHIVSCPLCNAAVDGMHHIPNINHLQNTIKSNPYKNGNYKWWLGAFGMIVISLAVYFYESDMENRKIIPQKSNSTSTLLDSNYTVNTNAEIDNKQIQADSSITSISAKQDNIFSKTDSSISGDGNHAITYNADSAKTDSVPVAKHIDQPTFSSTVNGFPVKYIYDMKVIDYSDVYEAVDIRRAAIRNTPANRENNKSSARINDADTARSEEVLKKALLNFSFNENKKTIELLNQLLKVFPDDQNAQFYSGVSCYRMNDNAKAIQFFEKVLAHRSTAFTEESEWYLALSLLRNNQGKEGRSLLEKIAASGGFYSTN